MVAVLTTYRQEVMKAMGILGKHRRTFFIGQTVGCPGSAVFESLREIPMEKRLELPVAEECQMGMSIGLALEGFIPVSVYPRIDFLLCAVNQLANHLDVLDELTHNEFKAKVIIRTMLGSKSPLYPGVQHCRDHTEVFKVLLKNVEVTKLDAAEMVVPTYERALHDDKSHLIIEDANL